MGPSFQPAPHIPMPLVFPHAGAVLTSVHLVTVTFDGYSHRAEVEAFGAAVVHASWFVAAGDEYQFVAGTQLQTRTLGPAPAMLSRQDLRDRIAGLVLAPAAPTADADSDLLYLLYVPPDVTFVDPHPRNFHDSVKVGGIAVPFAVVFDDDTGLAATTLAAARQLINAVTDPYKAPRDGYYADPPPTDPWSLILGEIADLCDGEDPIIESGFALPRLYSNRGAVTGNSPCKPFVPDDTWSDVSARPAQMPVVPAGSSTTFFLTGWSTRAIADWKLTTHAADRSDLTVTQMQPTLSNDTINNRITVTLTVTAPADAPSGATGGLYVLSGAQVHPWAVGFVVQ